MGKSKELAELGDVVTQSGGNVGVNTADPTSLGGGSKLTVNQANDGNIIFARGGSTRQVQLGTTSTTGYINADNTTNGLALHMNGTERMRIDASGRVTMPYQPLFFGTLSNHVSPNTNVPSPGNTITSFNVYENVGNHWNNTTGIFTCPVAGRYMMSAYYIKYPATSTCHVDVYKSGSYYDARIRAEETGGYSQASGMIYITCAANDTLEWKYFGGAGIHSGNGGWTIALVG